MRFFLFHSSCGGGSFFCVAVSGCGHLRLMATMISLFLSKMMQDFCDIAILMDFFVIFMQYVFKMFGYVNFFCLFCMWMIKKASMHVDLLCS